MENPISLTQPMTKRILQVAKGLLSALDIPKAHIVGLSQGGAIALQFVLDNPEMVDKLVLVDAGGLGAKPPFASLFSMILMNSFPSSVTDRFFSRYILFNPKIETRITQAIRLMC